MLATAARLAVIALVLGLAAAPRAAAVTVNLLPNSDAAIGTWQTLTGATTNLNQAINDSNSGTGIKTTSTTSSAAYFGMNTSGIPAGSTINSVTAHWIADSISGGGSSETATLGIRRASATGTVLSGAQVTLVRGTLTDQSTAFATAPDGSAWTYTAISDIQLGVVGYGLGPGESINATEMWIVVDYTAPANGSWVGLGADNNWTTVANWANSALPTASDVATFSGAFSTKPCTVNTVPHVKGVSIASSYTGTVTQGAGSPVFCGTSGFVMAGGTWTCSDTLYTPIFTQTGGTWSTSGTVYLIGSTGGSISATSTLSNLEAEGLDTGLAAYWKMEEATVGTAYDATVNANNGTHTNSPTISALVPTMVLPDTHSLDTTSTGERIAVPDAASLRMASTMTIAAWLRQRTVIAGNNGGPILEKRNATVDTSGYNYGLWLWNGHMTFQYYNGAWANWDDANVLPTNTWTHVAVAVNEPAQTVTMFLNGAASSSITGVTSTMPSSGTEMVQIGAHYTGTSIDGQLDEVRLYNRALSEAEIGNLQQGLGGDATQGTTFTLASNVSIAGTFKLDCGTLALGTRTLSVGGSCSLYGQVSGTTGVIALTGNGGANTLRCGEARIPNLTVNSAGGTGVWTLQDRLNVSGTLAIQAGQLDVGSGSNWPIRCGTLNQTGASTTLVPRSGTIVMDSTGGGSIKATTTLNALRVEGADETGLIGYWKFDKQSGLTHYDCSGNGHTATAQGAAMHSTSTPTPVTTQFENGGCATFDGVNDYMTVANSTGMSASSITVAAWVNPTSVGSIRHDIVSKWGTSGNYSYNLQIDDTGHIGADISTDGSTDQWAVCSSVLSTGTWYHVAMTYDGTTLKVWLNGSLDGAASWPGGLHTSPEPVTLGHIDPAFASGRWFAGLMDEVRIYSRALSPSEIRNLANGRYANGSSGTPSWTLAANLSTASLGIDAGTFNANGFATNVSGAFTMYDGQGAYVAGSATQTFANGFTMDGGTFTGGAGTVAVSGNFSMGCPTDTNGGMPQSGGAFTAPTLMTVSGSLALGAGTFTAGSGTVQLTGTGAGNTLTGVNAAGGGLYASVVGSDLRSITNDDWRTSQTISGQRLSALLNYGTDAWWTATERAAYGAGGSDANWDNYSVQWDGWITIPVDGTSLKTASDDGSRVWIDANGDGTLQTCEWGSNAWTFGQPIQTATTHYLLPAGTYRIRVQYEDGTGDNNMYLAWDDSLHATAGTTPAGDYIVPSAYLTPTLGGGLLLNNLTITGSGGYAINAPIYASGTITCTAGTLTQSSGAWIYAAGGWTHNGGTFIGSSASTVNDNVTIGGDFACSSGTFTCTKGAFNVGGNFTVNGTGTFAHNSGTVEFQPNGTKTVTCTQTFNHVRVNDSLVAYWSFDEASSPAIDLTGRGHDATWINSPTPSTTNVAPVDVSDPRALALNGTTQYLRPARQRDFSPGLMTVAVWAYMPSSAGWPTYIDLMNRQGLGDATNGGNGTSGWGIESANGGWRIFGFANNVFAEADSRSLTADTWHHVAGVYDGTAFRIFIDGIQHASTAAAGLLTEIMGQSTAIGRNEWGTGSGYMPGGIDELRFYNRALTPGEIHRLACRHDPGSSADKVQLGSALTVAGDVVLLSGALDASTGFDMTVSGNWTDRGGVFTPGTRKVTLNASGPVSVRSGNQPFYDLTLSGSGTYTAVDQMRTAGTLTLSSGTFVAPSTRLVCLGAFTVSGGTFTSNGGTLIMKSQTGSTLTCAQALNNVVFTDGLVAQWEFEETASPSLDVSGWNHTATWTSAPTSDASPPGLVTANAHDLQFNGAYSGGVSYYLTVPDGFEFQPASKLTIAAWLYNTTSSNVDEGAIIGRMGQTDLYGSGNPGNAGRGWCFMTIAESSPGANDHGIMLRVNSSLGNGANASYRPMPKNAWHHVAATFDAQIATIYIDGVAVANSNLGSAGTLVDPLYGDGLIWIGRNATYRGGGGFQPSYNGKADDLRFYDRDLSAAEVGRLASGREPQTSVATFSLGSNLTINGNLTIGSGTLDLGTRTVALAGSYRCEGKITGTTGTLAMSGTGVGNSVLCGNQSIPNVTVAGTGTWTPSDWFKAGSYAQSGATLDASVAGKPVTVGGNLTVGGGTLKGAANEVVATSGAFSDAGGTYQANAGVLELTSIANQSLNVAAACNHLWVASGAANGLVARFRLDEAQYGAAYDDVAGAVATPGGTPTASAATPTMATSDPSCADFSGATSGSDEDYLSVANSTALDNLQAGSYSLAAWFWPRALPAGTGTIDSYYGIVMKQFPHMGLIYDNVGRVYMNHYLSDGVTFGQAASGATYAPGAWYHLCGVVDIPNGTVKLYVNGALAGTGSFAANAATFAYGAKPWTIGIAAPGDTSWMWPTNGRIDDVRLYGRALSAQEALALATNGLDAANGTATFTLGHAAQVAGDVDLLGGTLSAAGLAISASASWRNLVGTAGFVAGGDTVTLNGTNQQLYGSTTFAGLTKSVASAATLTFPAFECQNVTGTLTLNGASGQLLSIRSSVSGSMATINPTGTRSCSFLDVKDSRNFVMPYINPSSSVNSGDTRWWFGTGKGNGVLIASPPVE